jgi:hypothetical protein
MEVRVVRLEVQSAAAGRHRCEREEVAARVGCG